MAIVVTASELISQIKWYVAEGEESRCIRQWTLKAARIRHQRHQHYGSLFTARERP